MENQPLSKQEGLYQPRSAEFAEHYIGKLLAPPESALSPEQQEELFKFEDELMDGRFTSQDGRAISVSGTENSLSEVERSTRFKESRFEICLDYFLTEEGRNELLGLGIETDDPVNLDSIATILRRTALDMPAEGLKRLQKTSSSYSDTRIAQALVDGTEIEAPPRITVFNNMNLPLDRAADLFEYKKFLADASRALKMHQGGEVPLIDQAKIAVLKIYRRRVNGLLAELEPDLIDAWRQIGQMDDVRRSILEQSLSMVWPLVSKLKLQAGSDSPDRLAVRMDRLRNGASTRDQKISVVSRALLEHVNKSRSKSHEDLGQALFTKDEIRSLAEIRFDAVQMQQMCKELLDKFGKLSSQPDDDFNRDRPVRAEDGRWQVPITTEVGAMEARDPPGGWLIPSKFVRSITNAAPPVGVASGIAHEYQHIVQNDNARNNPKGLRISKEQLRGRGGGVVKEAGAKMAEAEIQRRLFGLTRTSRSPYLSAILALEQGDGEIAAARTYFESVKSADPARADIKGALSAVSSTKRLARRKGSFDSEALNYAETALLINQTENLPESVKRQVFAEGSYSLEDMAELHKFGLLSPPPEPLPIDEVVDFLREKLSELLAKPS